MGYISLYRDNKLCLEMESCFDVGLLVPFSVARVYVFQFDKQRVTKHV